MEYTVNKLAKLAGITARALRYYDGIGLLKPKSVTASGYRLYGPEEVIRLQQVLFYRQLGMGLEEIGKVLASPDFDEMKALKGHRRQLLEKREQLERLIVSVEKTIASKERRIPMSDRERFEGFQKKLVEENERKYGKEIREKYGEEAVEHSNQKVLNMTKEEQDEVEKLSADVIQTLALAFAQGDPAGSLAQKAADLHRRWLSFFWDSYSPQAHAGLAQMYVEDPRFTAYYDREQPGTAIFLRDAILIYTRSSDKKD